MEKKSIRAIVFIPRCSGAATVDYELAFSLGLHEAPWALEYRALNLPHASRHMHGRSRGQHRDQHRQVEQP
jgi:hypothetical protein